MRCEIRLIAIAGATCSGKTTVARAVAESVEAARVVSVDWYYRDLSGVPFEARAQRNFDHPEAVDDGLLLSQLEALLAGKAIQAPRYDFTAHVREAATRRVEPGKCIVLEGLHALYWEEIRLKAATTVFMDLDDGTCLKRRIGRDVEERGRSEGSVGAQYGQTVRPMFDRYVAPLRAHADVVARGDRPVEHAVREILLHLEGRGVNLLNPDKGRGGSGFRTT